MHLYADGTQGMHKEVRHNQLFFKEPEGGNVITISNFSQLNF
jgi:hypothetical protein